MCKIDKHFEKEIEKVNEVVEHFSISIKTSLESLHNKYNEITKPKIDSKEIRYFMHCLFHNVSSEWVPNKTLQELNYHELIKTYTEALEKFLNNNHVEVIKDQQNE